MLAQLHQFFKIVSQPLAHFVAVAVTISSCLRECHVSVYFYLLFYYFQIWLRLFETPIIHLGRKERKSLHLPSREIASRCMHFIECDDFIHFVRFDFSYSISAGYLILTQSYDSKNFAIFYSSLVCFLLLSSCFCGGINVFEYNKGTFSSLLYIVVINNGRSRCQALEKPICQWRIAFNAFTHFDWIWHYYFGLPV